jgi:cytoskeletal protein CcmA (bactofilin family)
MKRFLQVAVTMVGLMAVPGLALAFGAQAGQTVTLPKGETKTGTYYVAGEAVTIDGDVNGDLICAGSSVSINGAVHGDVICAGQLVSINGPVDGSVRLAGQSVSINGTVGRNATVLAQALTVGSSGRIAGDLGVLGQTASVNGPVDKDVYGRMQSLSLGAAVGPVTAAMHDLALGSGAKVRGDLRYESEDTFTVDKSKVSGTIARTAPPVSRSQQEAAAESAGFALRLYWIVAALLSGLLLVWLLPRLFRRVTDAMLARPGTALGVGAVSLLLVPVAVIGLLVTVVGAPLGLLLLGLWALMLATSGLFAGVAVGRWLLARADWHKDSLLLAAVFGVPLAVILFSIPGLGGLIMLVAMCWGVGGLVLSGRALR